ncbi:MAG: hypothetical protein CM1200mP2_12060 [Planctomycetaceae bacterium]|nr:MAG: hypothetical protein CM1200mP2_12060 [Planctomycetaceae bacterium]
MISLISTWYRFGSESQRTPASPWRRPSSVMRVDSSGDRPPLRGRFDRLGSPGGGSMVPNPNNHPKGDRQAEGQAPGWFGVR